MLQNISEVPVLPIRQIQEFLAARTSVLSQSHYWIRRTHLVNINLDSLSIFRDAFNDIYFFIIINRLCIADSILSDEESTDNEENDWASNVACPDDSPWDVITAYEP